MDKVYQTVIEKGKGNCMQAAMASLFSVSLKEVPNFIEFGSTWIFELNRFLGSKGFSFDGTLYNPRTPGATKRGDRFPEIKNLPGVNGYFLAGVYSPKFYDKKDKYPTTHAVIIDKDFNIVHDPNKEYATGVKYPEWERIGYDGIIDILMINPTETN